MKRRTATYLVAQFFFILEIAWIVWSENIVAGSNWSLSNAKNDTRESRAMKSSADAGRGMTSDHDFYDVEKPKAEKPWLGYYDFLITEGSYKFWVVFQLFTIGILIYSAFAAIYYSKYTFKDYEENYDDYFLGRSSRSIRTVPSTQSPFLGLPVETYLQIFNAVYNYGNKLI